MTASSVHDNNDEYAAYHGRLHLQASESRKGAWSAGKNDGNQWLQIDLIGKYRVTRIATQGKNSNAKQRVTTYQLVYGNNTVSFFSYTGQERNLIKVK